MSTAFGGSLRCHLTMAHQVLEIQGDPEGTLALRMQNSLNAIASRIIYLDGEERFVDILRVLVVETRE